MADKFVEAFQTVMDEGGFTHYVAYAPGGNEDPNAVVEAILIARKPEAVREMALQILTDNAKDIH